MGKKGRRKRNGMEGELVGHNVIEYYSVRLCPHFHTGFSCQCVCAYVYCGPRVFLCMNEYAINKT